MEKCCVFCGSSKLHSEKSPIESTSLLYYRTYKSGYIKSQWTGFVCSKCLNRMFSLMRFDKKDLMEVKNG